MELTEKLKAMVDKAMATVDEAMFSRQQKTQVLRELRGQLLSMNQILNKPQPLPPPDGKDAA